MVHCRVGQQLFAAPADEVHALGSAQGERVHVERRLPVADGAGFGRQNHRLDLSCARRLCHRQQHGRRRGSRSHGIHLIGAGETPDAVAQNPDAEREAVMVDFSFGCVILPAEYSSARGHQADILMLSGSCCGQGGGDDSVVDSGEWHPAILPYRRSGT